MNKRNSSKGDLSPLEQLFEAIRWNRLTRRELLRRGAVVLGGLAAYPLLSGCAPVVTTAPAAAATTAPAATTGKAQLLYWDGYREESTLVDGLIAKFNESHPDIEIKREAQPQMRDILRTALDAGQGPDVFTYDTGPGFAGVLARAGLLLPLDNAYAEKGWNDRIFPLAKERVTFDGKPYGIGNQLEVVGMFYNKRIFQEQGIQEPKTHEEVLQAAEKLKAAGIIPIGFSDQDKWPAGHIFSVFAGNIAGRDKLAQAISGKLPWNDPDFVKAIDMPFTQMNKAGYFIPEINAVNYDDWNALFYSGKAAMSFTGTWQIANYSNKELMPDPVGFFLYPPVEGKPIAPPAGLGDGYFISSKTKAPDAAITFLDFLFSKETAKFWLEDMSRLPPIQLNPADYKIPELLAFTLDVLQKDADKMGYNIDVLTPETFNMMMFDGFQEVLGGTKTPQQQADDLQKLMEEAKTQGKVFDITVK